MPRGGKRAGAGRKPRTDGARAREYVLSDAARRVVEIVQAELRDSGKGDSAVVTASAVVERAILRGLLLTLGHRQRERVEAAMAEQGIENGRK